MSQLIIVSNRCLSGNVNHADPLLDALNKTLQKYPGKWYGWNGEINTSRKKPVRQQYRHTCFEAHCRALTPNEYDNYYQGYVHSVLWPVFHNRPDLASYKKEYFTTYKTYVSDVARSVGEELSADDIIWVHDYHMLPVGKLLRDDGHRNACGFFLHQPFPPGDVLRSIPEHDWLMNALLHYDLIGFQSSSDINNFLSYALRYYRAERVSADTLQVNGRNIKIGIFPCGIDTESVDNALHANRAVQDYKRKIIISNDVISDISGIYYRLDAMRTFLNHHPQYIRDVSLLQISDPSREYPWSTADLCTRLERFCGELNGQYGDFSWYPVNYIHNDLCNRALMYELYAKAHVALFTPLSEGTSLSAKEFILAQDPEDPGVLILSFLTGAAEQLSEAIIVNPYDSFGTSDALHSALSMPLHERKRRHSLLLEKVRRYDCQWWGRAFLAVLTGEGAKNDRTPPVFRTSHYGIFTPQRLY